jgi:two-component system chemotaxis response regulator CheY
MVRELIATIIENDGYCAVETQDGRAAYRQLLSDSSFAVVILEMTLPHLKGLDIVRYMRTEKRLMKIPVVVISGGNQLRLMADSFAAGANAFLHKPFTAQQLETTLRMFLSQNQPHAIQKPASISA